MRPPMQATALQQHEINRQQQHSQQQQQQQQQHHQQLHQLQAQISVATTTLTPTPPQRHASATLATNNKSREQQQQKLQTRELLVENHLNLALAGTATTTTTTTAPIHLPKRYEQQHENFMRLPQQQQQQQQNQHTYIDTPSYELIHHGHVRVQKLPPPPPPARRTATAPTAPHLHSTNSGELSKRYSLSSQYSRSSSSDDASSSSLSSNSRANTFDDAAEHFIINYPADSPDIQRHNYHTDSGALNLPLSETEPLLTNIEATVADTKRSIFLNKTSGASLVFTRKELQTPHTNNNQRRASVATTTPRNRQTLSLGATQAASQLKKTKHLPATYNRQQPQRRSLQLNYNNNLVTTTACGTNNNYCCGSGSIGSISHPSYTTSAANKGGNKVVLHKQHTDHNTGSSCSAAFGAGVSNNKTAAATRKQHAYSWYAPVYSALEEELEQDSRDSSPIHNLAQAKQKLNTINHYQQRAAFKTASLSQTENETVALLETRNQINIQQAQLSAHAKRESSSHSNPPQQNASARRKSGSQATGQKLAQADQRTLNGVGNNNRGSGELTTLQTNIDDGGPHAGSLGLAGGPLPRRKRFEYFLKSFFGLKSAAAAAAAAHSSNTNYNNNSSSSDSNINATAAAMVAPTTPPNTLSLSVQQRPISPEITITRTPSEQNLVILREPASRKAARSTKPPQHGSDKLAYLSAQAAHEGSTSSLNVVQQKLWNIMRREHSATSLHQEKSQSIVQYTAGLRKCETVLALTRQTASPTSSAFSDRHDCNRSTNSVLYTGSGIFNANGIEQIRPLNRLRNSVTSINGGGGTCSRCSSILSLAATGSRYSLNFNKQFEHTIAASASQQQLQYIPAKIGAQQKLQQQLDEAEEHMTHQHHQQQQQHTQRHSSIASSNSSHICFNTYTRLDSEEQTPPSKRASKSRISSQTSELDVAKFMCSGGSGSGSGINNQQASAPSNITTTATILYAKSRPTSTPNTPTMQQQAAAKTASTPTTTPTTTPTPTPTTTTTPTSTATNFAACLTQQLSNAAALTAAKAKDYPLSALASPTTTAATTGTLFNVDSVDGSALNNSGVTAAAAGTCSTPLSSAGLAVTSHDGGVIEMHAFEPFTCKLCLVDVDTAPEATTLQQCGCRFCTECMKAYVEFEISEAAYEISCPDAQCPTQGIMNLNEIASLTTANLMKKHHRYRLNREIELDKTRTWCPRAGCETICHVGPVPLNDATPSTSAHKPTIIAGSGSSSTGNSSTASPSNATTAAAALNSKNTVLWAVQCPSCKDEFCSACKKTWHPNISCEEHSRRLVADGQDDIGIPFDNDLIKCCPMCAVPIEKDEGCAQMMCKRCKHVFCWYCLASLDDDFLLRHYDKGPCKNKLGHSRASVVWHRAQVIGIFAGFGILLLVASPLLLLAAPCIICCKCRSCSGSKIDDGDDELDEATALQSS